MTLLAQTYTTQAEIERLMSKKSSELYVDDTGVGIADDPEIWDDAINESTDMVNMYTQMWYEATVLVTNSWCRRVATWIAAHLITMRRGNPGAYSDRYYDYIAMLERVKKGELQIPGAYQRAAMIPMGTNYSIDDRYPINKLRVQPSTSVETDSPRRDISSWPYADVLF